MRGILRLIEGLIQNDPTAWWVLGFTVVGTTVIVAITGWIQRRRRQK